MKQKTCFKLFITLLSITMFFANCQKGDVGPAGPAGPTGAAGAAGATGSQGPKGDTGTANVIYSAWLDVAYLPDTIKTGTLIDTVGYFANITANRLTNAILNSGEIKVYMNFGTSATPNVVPLPYFDVNTFISIAPEFLLQRIFLYSNANASTVTQGGQKFLQYRYILIPGAVPGFAGQPVDWNDYKKVKEYLGLTD